MKTYHYGNYHIEKQETGEWILFTNTPKYECFGYGWRKKSMVELMNDIKNGNDKS